MTTRELLLLGLLLAQFAETRATHADPLCSSAPPAELVVDMSYAEPQFSAEKSVAELRFVAEAWGIPASERQAHPLLVVSSNVDEGAVILEASATQVGPGAYCPSPRAVTFRIHFADRWVFVAREALASPDGGECIARLLREHGEKIIKLENTLLTDFANTFPDRFRPDFVQLKQTSAPNAVEAESHFKSGVRQLVDGATLQLISKRNETVAAIINSPAELQRLRSACAGAVGRAEAALVPRR